MVLPAPAPGQLPDVAWFARIEVALHLATRGVLTLVDHAAPGQLRRVWLRLVALESQAALVVTAQALFDLPEGSLVLYAPDPEQDGAALNLMRPIVAERRYRVVLWCQTGVAAQLLAHAPDFFDWITAHVECPWAPLPHTIATIVAAARARAAAVVWTGPDLERTLAWLRPGRAIHRITTDDYDALIEALQGRGATWLLVEDVHDDFAAQRLAFALLESGRRRPCFVAADAPEALRQPWHQIRSTPIALRDASALLSTARLPLAALVGLEADAVATAMVLPTRVAAAGTQLRSAGDPGPLLGDPPVPDADGPAAMPLARLRRQPVQLPRRLAYGLALAQWPEAGWPVRVSLGLSLSMMDLARRWLAHAPDTQEAVWLRASCTWREGRPLEALAELKATSAPATAAHLLLRGRILRDLEVFALSRQALECARTMAEPDHPVMASLAQLELAALVTDEHHLGSQDLAGHDSKSQSAQTVARSTNAPLAAMWLRTVFRAVGDDVAAGRVPLAELRTASARLQQATELLVDFFGEQHEDVVETRRELACMAIIGGDFELAETVIAATINLGVRLYRARHHPEMAKLQYVAAVANARIGRLDLAAVLVDLAAATCGEVYPPEHSSHRALARLREEVELRRGHAAAWWQYQAQPTATAPGWWNRLAFSLAYKPRPR